MWHPIERVTQNQFLDLDTALAVAHERGPEFGIVDLCISTWYADKFIVAVRERQGDRTEAIRAEHIARLVGKN